MNESINVVPFLGYNEELKNNEFIGTAFLVNPNFLVTAGHNIGKECNKIYKSFSILFKENLIQLKQPIYFEYTEQPIIEGDYKDLAIFLLDVKFQNAFKLSDIQLENGDKFQVLNPELSAFLKKKDVTINFPTFSYRNYSNKYAQLTKYNNCFGLKEKLDCGYSGSPIFNENKVVGMIVYGNPEEVINISKNLNFGATALKSQYILSVLENI